MVDSHSRKINYLRVSVTDRCNFNCVYCRPPGNEWLKHSEILLYEEMIKLIRLYSQEGISKIRITGGEPLVRKGIVGFVQSITDLGVIDDISMTTNGSLLPSMAYELKKAGLHRVNVSLDTVNPEAFKKITTCGRLSDTLEGIKSALDAGLSPVKLNVVLTDTLTQSDFEYFAKFVHEYPISIRFIEYMPFNGCVTGKAPDMEKVKEMLKIAGLELSNQTSAIKGNGPAKYFDISEAKGAIGFITPISNHFCNECNRLRLTADGKLKPCLLSNEEIDVKGPLRAGASDEELLKLYRSAVQDKPKEHKLCRSSGYPSFDRKMSQIGG